MTIPTAAEPDRGRQPGPDLRLLPAATAAWVCTWWATAQQARPVLIGAGVAAAAVGVLLGVLALGGGLHPGRAPRRLVWATGAIVVAAAASAVLAASAVRLLERERDPLTASAADHLTGSFTGRVVGDPRPLASRSASGEDRWAVRVAVHELTVRGRTVKSSGELVAFGGPRWSGLVAGSHVRGTGRLEPARRGDPESAVVFPRGAPTLIDPGGWIWRAAERLRLGLRNACEGLPSDARGLLPALVVGDTSHLSRTLRDDLRAAGLTHLTAVSGANVAILASVVVAVIGGLGGGRRVRVAGTGLAIVGFVVLARPEPSVLRAAVMGGLALIGLLMARRGAGVPMLAATAVLLLVTDPWLSRSYGFVLSVLATAGLLLLAPAWLERCRRWPRPIVIALAVPVAAQVATGPVTVLLNPAVSLVAVPANLLVEVAVAPATIAGVGAAALSPIWPTGAHVLAFVGGLATEWIAIVAHRAAALPGGSLPWPGGLQGALLLAAVTVVGVVLSLRRAWLALSLCLAAVVGLLIAPRWVSVLTGAGWPPPDWIVVQCDVGQGSSTLIRSGDHRAVIVDTGPDPALVDSCLHRTGVTALDLVVITHFHADHAGGLAGALDGRGSPPIVVSPLAEPEDEARDVVALAASIGRRPVVGVTGMAGRSGVGSWAVRWRLLPPPSSWQPAVRSAALAGGTGSVDVLGGAGSAPGDAQGTEINNASVVLFAEVQGLRVMALGDVEPEAQRPLVRTIQAQANSGSPLAPVDVVVVAHHGSARQEPALYELLRPRIALIGVGVDNDYGHPSPSALTLLRRIGALVLRTDLQGQLAVTGPAGRLRVATSK
jgi:competence protein ComEC